MRVIFDEFKLKKSIKIFSYNNNYLSKQEGIMNTAQLIRKGFLGLLGLFFSASLWAHGGAAGTDTDQCKF